jgi:hypothetical protein
MKFSKKSEYGLRALIRLTKTIAIDHAATDGGARTYDHLP